MQLLEVAVIAPEVHLIGQHRHRGSAGAGVSPSQVNRIGVHVQITGTRRSALHLRDKSNPVTRRRALEDLSKSPCWSAFITLGDKGLERPLRLARRNVHALV